MTRGTSRIVPAALAFLAAILVTGAAMAQCPSGTYQCGADYCTPDGAVCCANVGWPEYYCPSGSSCQSDGSCQSGSSSNVSSSSSSGTTGGSDSCPSGSYACGADYCTPDGAVCCANVGWPEYYCPGGSVCLEDGSCGPGSSSNTVSSSSSSSGTTGGSDDCPSGSYACGADYCTPLGEVCCADVGLPQYYCPSGTLCQSDGSCAAPSTSASSVTGSSSSNVNGDTTSSGTSTSGGGTSGTGTSSGGPPQVDGCSSYYDYGYDEYQVEVQCQSAYIYACSGHQEGVTASCDILDGWGYGSREACPYCTGTDPREGGSPASKQSSSSDGGCAVTPGGSPAGETLLLLSLFGFGGVLRRRLAKPAVRA